MKEKPGKTRWTFREDRRLIDVAASLKSLEAVATQMSRSKETVAKMARRLGISLEPEAKGHRKSAPTERLKAARLSASVGRKPKARLASSCQALTAACLQTLATPQWRMTERS
jgi:hypothetical protein